jgi:hypothetical protein
LKEIQLKRDFSGGAVRFWVKVRDVREVTGNSYSYVLTMADIECAEEADLYCPSSL